MWPPEDSEWSLALLPADDCERIRHEGASRLAILDLVLPFTLPGDDGVGLLGAVGGIEPAGEFGDLGHRISCKSLERDGCRQRFVAQIHDLNLERCAIFTPLGGYVE